MIQIIQSLSFIAVCAAAHYTHGANEQHLQTRRPYFLNPSLSLRGGENDVTAAKKHVLSQSDNGPCTKSPYEYIPVTALDDYGQSTQLRHAIESAARHGTPVLACLCRANEGEQKKMGENAVLVCSLQRSRPGIIARSSHELSSIIRQPNRSRVHPSIQSMVQVLATRDDSTGDRQNDSAISLPKHSLHTALISTGLQSDVSFLLNKLQSHLMKHWFRYDKLPNGESLLRMIREILLDFLGYEWSEEVGSSSLSGGIGSAAPSSNDAEEENTRAGRPLGVAVVLMELEPSNSDISPLLTVIKANGSSEKYVAHAMGIGSELGNKRLAQKWNADMTVVEAKKVMRGILKEIAIEKGWLNGNDATKEGSNGDDSDEFLSEITIICETITTDGIDVEYSELS